MNYYQILDIPINSSIETIKKKYRRLALIYHPDRSGSKVANSEKFIEITEAYTILSNPITKQKYDLQHGIGETNQNLNMGDLDENSINNVINTILKPFGLENTNILENLGINGNHLKTFSSWIRLDTKQANRIFETALEDVYQNILAKNSTKSPVDNKITTEYRDLIIDYELEDHYKGDYYKTLQLTVNGNSHSISIDTSKSIHNIELLLDNVFYILDIKCVPVANDVFYQVKQTADLYHTINIPISAFINGFYYTLDIFGQQTRIFFKSPHQSHLVYRILKMGLPKDPDIRSRGNIIFILKLDKPTPEQLTSLTLIDLEHNESELQAESVDLSLVYFS